MVPYTIDTESSDLVFDIPPLSFDRVHEGHVTTSLFPLFQMPVELFSHFLNYLSIEDLLVLSQVDRDCRRLATLSMFKDVKLCFTSDIRRPFLERIPFSTTDQSQHSPSSYIASCVRRLNITAGSFNSIMPNYDTIISEYDNLSSAKIDPSLNNFIGSASYIVQTLYPNIHILDWDAPTLISATTLNSILTSPIKHLRLKGTMIHDDNSISHSISELSLETLSFDVSFVRSKHCRSPHVFKDILLRTSATLRQLIVTGRLNDDEVDINSNIPMFPCLRSVTLDIVSDSAKVIQLLLGPSTRVETLAIDVMEPSTCNFFAARGYVSSLKKLCLLNHSQGDLSSCGAVLEFLQNNTQLEALHIPCPASSQFLLLLVPSLCQNFSALNSLHLVWASPDIHEDALETLCTIHTLRHLWLSAGNQNALRSTWEVDHQSILTRLSPLRHLETFALSGDAYKVNAHPLAPRSFDYYASRVLPVDLDISEYLSAPEFDVYQGQNADFSLGSPQQMEMHHLAWERWHMERMLAITNEYMVTFPALRWLFIGQLLFTKDHSKPFALAHTPARRDAYLIFLQKKMSTTLWRPI